MTKSPSFAGIYEFFDNVVRIEARSGHLLVRLPWEAVEFYQESDNKCFRKDFDAQLWWCEEIDVVRDENDQITGFTITADSGNIQRLLFVKL